MKRIHFAGIAASLALLFAAGCGAMGQYGYPSRDNYPYPSSPSTYPGQQGSDMLGTVNNIDTRAQRIDLTVNAINGHPNNPYQTSVYYDSRTQVLYQGRSYSASNLEPGDQIDVSMYYDNGRSVAGTITVTADVRNNQGYPGGAYPGSSYPPNNYPNDNYPQNTNEGDIRGTVNYVDTQAQRIDLGSAYATNLRNSGGRGNYSIFYDSRTQVLYQGQTYRPADLERGDQVDVRVFNNGNGQYQADTITVTRNIRQ